MAFQKLASIVTSASIVIACGGDDGANPPGGASGTGATGMGATAGVAGMAGSGGVAAGGASGSGTGAIAGFGGSGAVGTGGTAPACGPPDTTSLCSQPNPGGPDAPPPFAYSGGTCPPIQAWHQDTKPYNMIAGGRSFIYLQPSNPCPGERFPLVFLWHWISGEAKDWLAGTGLQGLADEYRVAFVAPEAKGAMVASLDTQWPFDVLQPQARMDEEFRFFDDMLSCVASQYPINNNCVASLGVSAGGLFNSQLLQARGGHLASAAVLSGGVGDLVKPWLGTPHKMPVLVLWGGPTDAFGPFSFDAISRNLANGVASNGQFLIECQHTCGHFPPIFDSSGGNMLDGFSPFVRFLTDHPYWLPDGASPFQMTGLVGFPGFCGIGLGSSNPAATPACPMTGF